MRIRASACMRIRARAWYEREWGRDYMQRTSMRASHRARLEKPLEMEACAACDSHCAQACGCLR
eukprot:500784-Pleurochrysis_carterae.AAC.1